MSHVRTLAAVVVASLVASASLLPRAHADDASTAFVPELKDGLATALRRDLQMSPTEFRRQGALAEERSSTVKQLRGTQGVQRVFLKDDRLHVAGKGAVAKAAATRAGAVFTEQGVSSQFANVDQLTKLYKAYVGAKDLVSIGQSVDGFVIQVKEPKKVKDAPSKPAKLPGVAVPSGVRARMTPAQFAALFPSVKLVESATLAKPTAYYAYGGQGWEHAQGGICSLGFPGFTAYGGPLYLTAGHCLEGVPNLLVRPRNVASEPAFGGTNAPSTNLPIGYTSNSAFGRADISNTNAYDLGLIDRIMNYELPPAVYTWKEQTTPVVTGVVEPLPGQAICRSGRTSGWRCGRASEVGWVAVQNTPTDVRYVWSVMARNVLALGGDSGGPWVSGYKALGIMSAAGTDSSGAAVITASLATHAPIFYPGWQYKLYMYRPGFITGVSVTSANWPKGSVVQGTLGILYGDSVAPGTVVKWLVDGVWYSTPVAPDGKFSFTYQRTSNTTQRWITFTTNNGFSTSLTTSLYVTG